MIYKSWFKKMFKNVNDQNKIIWQMHLILKLSLLELPWEYSSFYFSLPFQEGKFSILLTPTGQAAFLYLTLTSEAFWAPSPVCVWE